MCVWVRAGAFEYACKSRCIKCVFFVSIQFFLRKACALFHVWLHPRGVDECRIEVFTRETKQKKIWTCVFVYFHSLLQGLARHQLTTYQKTIHGCSFQVDTKPLPNLGQLDDAEKAREEVAFSCIGIAAIAAWFAWQLHGLNIKIIYQVLRYQFWPQNGTYWNMWGFELNTSKMNHVVCGSKDLKLWYHRFLHGNVFAYGISTEAPPCAVHHLGPAAKGKQMVKTTWQMGDIMIHHPPKRDALTHGRSWGSKFNHAMEQPKECCLVSLLREGMEDYEVLECKLETIRTTT